MAGFGRVRTLAVAALLAACGGGTGAGYTTAAVERVVVSPETATLAPGEELVFHAEVVGRAGISQAVRWSCEAASGAAAGPGAVDADGRYRAPAVSPDGPVRVRAVSVEDPAREASATISFPPAGVSVAPALAELFYGESIQFTASVSGSADRTVAWAAQYGRIDATGLYHAPAEAWLTEDTVRAASAVSGRWAEARVLLRLRPPVLAAISGPAGPGDTVTLTGSDLIPYGTNAQITVLFPSVTGAIPVVAAGVSIDAVTAIVPLGSASGLLRLERRIGDQRATSNALPFERQARLRLRPERAELAAGERMPLRVAFLGTAASASLTFEADIGTIEDGIYSAPPTVTEPTFANVRACLAGTTVCSGATLALHPFTVSPSPALVPAGRALDLVAHAGGAPMPATFQLAAGGGSVTAAGTYRASAALEDAGPAWLVASAGATWEPVQVGVTGTVPGLLTRVVDFVDHHWIDATTGAPRGTYAEAVAVGGGRAYVVGSEPVVLYGARSYFWIDVYDLADPLSPRWVGAVESATRPQGMFVAHGRLYAWAASDWSAGFDRTLAVYDLSGPLPALVLREQSARGEGIVPWLVPSFDEQRLYDFGDPAPTTLDLPLRIRTLADDPGAPGRTVTLTLPPDADRTSMGRVDATSARGGRAYAAYWTSPRDRRMAVWDLVSDPPALLGTVEGGGYGITFAGPVLVLNAGSGTLLYDARTAIPTLVGTLPFGASAVGGAGGRHVLRSDQSGYFVLDVTDPASPRLAATLYAGLDTTGSAAVDANLLYAAEGLAGVGIYDVAPDGGPLLRGMVNAPGTFVVAAVQRGRYLYAAGAGYSSLGSVWTWDVTRSPPELVSALPFATVPSTLALAGDRLLVGRASSLDVLDLLDPAAPSLAGSTPLDVSCAAADGDVAWVGTFGGDLVAVDLAAPAGPREVGRTTVGVTPYAVDVLAPGWLAVALTSSDVRSGDLAVIDGTTPAAPALVANAGLGLPVFAVAHEGGTALLATAVGLVTVDVSTPSLPQPLVALELTGTYPYGETHETVPTYSLALDGGIAWLGTGYANGAIHGVDVRNPLWPREVARAALGSMTSAGIYALAVGGGRGFAVGDLSSSDMPQLVEFDTTQPRNVVVTLAPPRALQW